MSLKEEKLDYIKQFAFEHFSKFGFSRVTMDEIAKETKVGKGTLYRYFPSKEDLLIAVVEFNIAGIEKKLKETLTEDKEPVEKLNCYIDLLSKKMKHLDIAMLADIERSVPRAYKLICEARERIISGTLAGIMEEGKEKGLFRKDLDSAMVVNIFLGASDRITNPRILDTFDGRSVSEIMREIFRTILQGCYSEEGQKQKW